MKTQHPNPPHTQPTRSSRNSRPPKRASSLALAAAVGVASLCQPTHAQIVFTDTEFTDADWTSSKYQDTTPGGAATLSFQREAAGGNPGAYQQVTLGLNDGNIFSVHLRGGVSYDPATLGAVTGLHWAADLRGDPDVVGANFGLGPLIRQGGLYYANFGHSVNVAAWQSFNDNNLQAGGLFLLTGQVGPALPDFTAAGGTLEFGFYVIKSVDNSGPYSLKAGIDNWRVEVSSVPEPEGWALLSALGLGGLALARRRNRPLP